MDDLKPVIKAQFADAELRAREQPQRIEAIAAIGLVHLALDTFAATHLSSNAAASNVNVGQHVVTDQSNLTAVRTAGEQVYRCTTLLIQEESAAMRCEPPAGK
jgi:hypothetical protein